MIRRMFVWLYALPVAFWALMFLVFLGLSAVRGMPRTARIDRIARSPYLPRVLMEYGYWMFDAPARAFMRLGITPNMITVLSLVFTVVAAVCFAGGRFFEGGWALLFGFMCDAWDGIVARKTNVSSPGGEFFDATIDRYNDLIAFLGLMYYYRNDLLPLGLATATMIGSTLTSYTRAKGESVGIDPNVGWMQRHERGVYLGFATCTAPIVAHYAEPGVVHPRFFSVIAMLALMAVTANVTAIWRARFVLAGLDKRDAR
ncbi:MAG TPA: CDP-alcohol phosphatidyltransferase family protein, partial [Polyangia bacterium]|nr:CDP-alcohol phosphatidyltransferase family protein [Polyangia bacterium]